MMMVRHQEGMCALRIAYITGAIMGGEEGGDRRGGLRRH